MNKSKNRHEIENATFENALQPLPLGSIQVLHAYTPHQPAALSPRRRHVGKEEQELTRSIKLNRCSPPTSTPFHVAFAGSSCV